MRLSLATDLDRSKFCRFRVAPGFRARGLGTPVFDGDGIRLEAQALTLSPDHPARVRRARDGEAALALGTPNHLTMTRFAERAPGGTQTGDALQFVRLFHREDDTLLVASTNMHKTEPYLRHISRRKESPGKGLWILEFEDPLTGDAFDFSRKVRLRHACSDRHLAVKYGENDTTGPAQPELVDLKDTKSGAPVRSLFRLKPVRDDGPASGFACLITHDVRPKAKDGDRITLYLRAGTRKKHTSRHIVIEDHATISLGASLGATVEVHIELGSEALTLQALKAARTAVEEHADFIRRVGAGSEDVTGCAARARILRAENALRSALGCLGTSGDDDLEAYAKAAVEDDNDNDNDGVDDDAEAALSSNKGPVDAAAQSMTREVKLIDALARAIACVKTSGIKYPPAPGDPVDKRFGPLEDFHQLAYAVLVTCVHDNRRNETYFAKGRLAAKAGRPEQGAFMDQVIAEVSEPLGAPELLTTLIANNLDLTHQLVDRAMVTRLASFAGDHGPRPDLARLLAATLSCHGKAIPGIQEMVVDQLFTPDAKEVFDKTFLETSVVEADTSFRAADWPCAPIEVDFDYLGSAELNRGWPPICVKWRGSAKYPDEALFYDAHTLGLRTDASGWVELRELTRELDEAVFTSAKEGAKNEPAATDRINRRRQLAEYYVEQIKLIALCCQDRSYNAIDVFEETFTYSCCLWVLADPTYPALLRAAFASLLRSLHVDRSPHRPRCGAPSLPKRAWAVETLVAPKEPLEHLPRFKAPSTEHGVVALPTKLYLLKEFVRIYLADPETCAFRDPARNALTLQVLEVVDDLVDFGFYATKDHLRKLCGPLFSVLSSDAEESSSEAKQSKTIILRTVGKIIGMLGQCLIQAALTEFLAAPDAGELQPHRPAAKKSFFRRHKVQPDDGVQDTRSAQAERFLAFLDPPQHVGGLTNDALLLEHRLRKNRSLIEEVNVADMCGKSDAELDELLLKLAGSGSDDLLREVLTVTKALRCPTSSLLEVLEDCVVVRGDCSRTIYQTLSATKSVEEVVHTIPHLAEMTAELFDLAQRSEQWVLINGERALNFQCRAEDILRTLGRLLDPALSNDILRNHQQILLKCGLAPSIMEALEVDRPADAKDDGSLREFHGMAGLVASRLLAQHADAQRAVVDRLAASVHHITLQTDLVRADADGDGALSAAELRAISTASAQQRPVEVGARRQSLDDAARAGHVSEEASWKAR